jgi:LuxR family maltose regulon positive regulatory protein
VPRHELTARLDADYRVALVSAPAGYGKTATLASWAAGRRDHLAWLSCDASGVEPTRFMWALLSSLSARWPGVADDAFLLLERDGANTYDSAVAVANELATIDDAGVIVVDDLHLAAPAPAMMTAFIEALPPRFRFVAGSRFDPALPLARLRMRGELLELRSSDLRFHGTEMSQFLDLHDVQLADDERAQLHELTEGWPAGAQLAAIALQRGVERDGFLWAFANTDRALSDFLMSEVLASLPSDLVDFLVETSVLEAFDAELCVAVTGVDDAAALLDRLVAANLFVVPLDDAAGFYRYHHLFAAFLRARLASLGRSKRRATYERASQALEQRGDIAGALTHAMAINDVSHAGKILRSAVDQSMSMAIGADVAVPALRLWLHQFGEEFVQSDPKWVLELLVGLITLSGPDDVPTWLEKVRRAHPEPTGEVAGLIEGAYNEHHQHRGQPLEALRHVRLSMDAVGGRPPSQGLLSLLYTVWARGHVNAGEVDRAAEVLDHALANPVGNRVPDEVRHPGLASFVAGVTGELSRADELATRALAAADGLGLGDHEPGRIFARLALAEVHVERAEDEAALHLLAAVERAGDASRRLTLQGTVALQQARAARRRGDAARADAFLTRTRLFYPAADDALRTVLDDEAVLQALRFDPSTSASLIAALDQRRTRTRELRARLALLDDDRRLAADILAGLAPPTNRRARVERSVLLALSVLGRDVDQANAHMHDAIAASYPERLIRTIIDIGPDVHRALRSFTPSPDQRAYVQRLLDVAGSVVAPVRAGAASTLVEQLSDREVTVLRYLCSRLTQQEMAAALFVSVNTMKSHVRNVYRKLGVASRAEAVEAGRRHGLV